MSRRAGLARVFSLFFATAACNGQFDFDTAPLDAGQPPIVVPDGAADDGASRSEPATDIPGTGVRIGCGTTDCTSGACCSGTSGASCVDVAEGGTCSGVLIQCDDTDDCSAGQVCCAEGDVGPRPQRVHCEPESHCRAMNFVILCNPVRPSPCAQCIATTLTGLPPGYHQCAAAP